MTATQIRTYDAVMERLRADGALGGAAERVGSELAERMGVSLPVALNLSGAVGDDRLQKAFAAISGIAEAKTGLVAISLPGLSPEFLKARRLAVLGLDGDEVELGMVDPLDEEAIRGIAFATGKPVRPMVMTASEQRRAHAALHEAQEEFEAPDDARDGVGADGAGLEFSRDAPVARMVAGWIVEAVRRRASDVHIEPRKDGLVVRYRIDGVMQAVAEQPLGAASSVLARIKVLADLDLGERRVPQDGRTTAIIEGRPIDLRVSVVPSVRGESAVLRILDRKEIRLDYEALGFEGPVRDLLERVRGWPHGLCLVTGPTGSGKTTTLYASLEALRHSDRKILAVEDPVEFHFDHVTQVQVSAKAGVTFPSAIRAFLRQDPDVILVGEIRDADTARAAVQAALTGHLVLATLHAIDAERAAARLLDMGVEPFQLAACLKAVIAQRLVRGLCPSCRTERVASMVEQREFKLRSDTRVYDACGCPACGQSGYAGRFAVAEGFEADTGFASDLLAGGNASEAARARMHVRMLDDGVRRAQKGLTSLAELSRALAG
jgi:general secretion pathway protein E